mgnify:CR=1 FL=1
MYEKVMTKVKETSVLFRERQTDSQLAGLQEQAGECRATEGQKQAEAICLRAKLWGFLAFKMFPFPLASFSFLKATFLFCLGDGYIHPYFFCLKLSSSFLHVVKSYSGHDRVLKEGIPVISVQLSFLLYLFLYGSAG